MTMAILPEWNSLPDMVLYSWAGARLPWSSGTSCIPSMKVELFRRYRGALTAISAVLQLLATVVPRGPTACHEGYHRSYGRSEAE